MAKVGKRFRSSAEKVSRDTKYDVNEAFALLKQMKVAKFNESVDVAIRLGIDSKKSDQMVRGVASLPHGTEKTVRVLVLTTPDKEAEAVAAGADFVGLDEFIEKIKDGWTDIDVIICSPNVMGKVGPLGRVLGPRGLMPNPKSGTVTMEIGKAVTEVKAGKIDFKVDKTGIIHAGIGKTSFTIDQLAENARELTQVLQKLKPSSSKGTYFRSIYLSSSMGPGIKVDNNSVGV